MGVYANLIQDAEALGLPTIADVKRGDIWSVAAAYAEAHLAVSGATCVTVNPYMGADAVLPFLEETRRLDRGGGVFVLVATSNPSAETFQGITSPPLFEVASRLVAELGREAGSGYPDAGAVVGATRPETGRRVRELLPDALFLVPGYGMQGGGAGDVRPLLNARGAGVLVNSSRGVIYAHEGSRLGYREAAREAARRAREELHSIGARL
jgi:orotidine-5'-phosphate decarboxylase